MQQGNYCQTQHLHLTLKVKRVNPFQSSVNNCRYAVYWAAELKSLFLVIFLYLRTLNVTAPIKISKLLLQSTYLGCGKLL